MILDEVGKPDEPLTYVSTDDAGAQKFIGASGKTYWLVTDTLGNQNWYISRSEEE